MLPQRASGLVSAVVAVHPSPCRSAGRPTTMGHGPSQPGTGPVPSATKPAGGEAHGKRAGAAQRRRARRRRGGPGQGPDGDGGRGAGADLRSQRLATRTRRIPTFRRPPGPLVATGIAVGIVAISTSPILVREAHVPALALAFWRCLAGALLLAPFALRAGLRARRAEPEGPGGAVLPEGPGGAAVPEGPGGAAVPAGSRGVPLRRDLGWLALSGACLALHFSLWNASLALTTVASSTVLVACSPLFVGVLAGPLLGEPPSRL